MSEHVWVNHSMPVGSWDFGNGVVKVTQLQGWQCKICKMVTHTPLGAVPEDFEQIKCITPPPEVKSPWKSPTRERASAEKKDYPAKKKKR